MRSWSVVSIAALVAVSAPLPVSAQSRPCNFVLDRAGGTGTSKEIRPGVYHQFAGGGVLAHCRGESTTMRSDSVAYYSDLDRMDMHGKAEFEDSTVRLDARRAVYFLRAQRLEAYGDVVLLNKKTGSRLSGPALVYRRATAGRDTAELLATQKPHAEYRSENDTAGAPPYLIDADRMRFRGNNRAWAAGNVSVTRSDFASKSDSAQLDMGAGEGLFVGHAQVRGARAAGADSSAYVLNGRNIRYRMKENRLVWARAFGLADASSSEWRLVGDTIEFDVQNNQITGGRAWGDSIRTQAASRTYSIAADSIALDAPHQRLRELRGFGAGYATSRTDSSNIAADWMAGDTIVAKFDSTAFSRSSLTRLLARGKARAFYHVADPKHPGFPGINYSRGTHIAALFTPLGLDRVDVVGNSDGIYIEPGPAAPPAPAVPAQAPPAPAPRP